MKSGDLFEFFTFKGNTARSTYTFFDELTQQWTPVNRNIFMCIAFIENYDWKNTSYVYSLFFTNGAILYHLRIDGAMTTPSFGGGGVRTI